MSPLKPAALIGIAFLLSGCGYTRYSMYNSDEVRPPSSPPKIIRGHVANYWISTQSNQRWAELDQEIIAAWKATKLFKDVVPTYNAQPPAQGTFIKTDCNWELGSDTTGFAGTMMWMFTLGAMPSQVRFETVTCTSQIFQNGALLVQSTSEHVYRVAGGSWLWALTNSEKNVFKEGNASAAAHIVSKDLVALKKAYP
ncbi:MAG: hypothetical protein OEV23_00940 [Gallionella sp.]|nr:hypothetical protein [Gallionella sp.]